MHIAGYDAKDKRRSFFAKVRRIGNPAAGCSEDRCRRLTSVWVAPGRSPVSSPDSTPSSLTRSVCVYATRRGFAGNEGYVPSIGVSAFSLQREFLAEDEALVQGLHHANQNRRFTPDIFLDLDWNYWDALNRFDTKKCQKVPLKKENLL